MPRSPAALLALLVLAAAGSAGAAPGSLSSVGQIEECIRGNLPERTTHQRIRFKNVDRVGEESVSQAEIFWRKFEKGSRALLRFSAPADIRGSSLLMIQKTERTDMFMYLPELQKVRRVTGRSVAGSIFGTDFSYEDFERLQGLSGDELESTRLADSDIEGRGVYVLESRPAQGSDSQYERIVSYVDHRTCVPLRTDLYDKGERLRKVLRVPQKRILRKGPGWYPTLYLMKDMIDETYTELIVDEVEIDTEIPRKLFSERELQQSGR